MGRQVAANYGDSKHQMVLTDQAAGTVSGANDEVRVFVGDNALPRMTEAQNRIIKCLNAFIERSAVVPAQFGTYSIDIDDSVASAVTDGAVPGLSEDDVAVIVGGEFLVPQTGGSSQVVDQAVRQAADLLLEDRKDA